MGSVERVPGIRDRIVGDTPQRSFTNRARRSVVRPVGRDDDSADDSADDSMNEHHSIDEKA